MRAREIEGPKQRVGHAEHQHVTVLGLYLAALQNSQAMLAPEGGVVRFTIELAMLGQHESINGEIACADPLTIVFHLRPTVVGLDGVSVQIQDHEASRGLVAADTRCHCTSRSSRSSASEPELSSTTSARDARSSLDSWESMRACTAA